MESSQSVVARTRSVAGTLATGALAAGALAADIPVGEAMAATTAAMAAAREERERILRWVHDSALQALEYIASQGRTPRKQADFEDLARVADTAARELRRFMRDHDDPVPCGSLAHGVREVVDEARPLADHRIDLTRGIADGSVAGPPLAALLGALRETLANARKHSGARRVSVYLEEEAGCASITVRDDGGGATCREIHAGFGIRECIVERMQAARGWALLERAPDGGLVVRLGVGADARCTR
ncbi:MAG: hypothetical protein MUE51_13775 [Thermoleophilia bacterium]|nr:hypothetical protein [Thermoleophilia bacterium]